MNSRARRNISSILAGSTFFLLTSCAGHQQSSIDPGGPESGKIATLWWFFFALLSAIFIIVMALTARTLTRGSREIAHPSPPIKPDPASETRLRRVVTGASSATVVILFALLIVSIGTGKSVAELGDKKDHLTIDVTGNQWWWQFRYENSDPSQTLVTANEIHIPLGHPVLIRGMSNDVIHSFWVPGLNGKRDLIPSHVTTEWIEADRPGRYRGQCAEFCGLQHAHMAFWVVAEPEAKFEAWRRAQLQPAVPPSDPILQHGQQAFLSYACVFCHQIRGTTAAADNGPDLTHFGSRISLAAGARPNVPGNLAGWILNPQSIKPGNHMATIAINPQDLQPLMQYLESLK